MVIFACRTPTNRPKAPASDAAALQSGSLLPSPFHCGPELRHVRGRPRPEVEIHHGVLVELHFASPSDHVRIHRPRQSVIAECHPHVWGTLDRKSTRLNSSHLG